MLHTQYTFQNLLNYLGRDSDGKEALNYFNDHKCLSKDLRATLTRTIIKKFKNDALKTVGVGENLVEFK